MVELAIITKSIRESFYHDVSIQIQKAYLNGDSVILVANFTTKLGPWSWLLCYQLPLSGGFSVQFQL